MVTLTEREGIIIKYEILIRTTPTDGIQMIAPNMGWDNLQAFDSAQPRNLKKYNNFVHHKFDNGLGVNTYNILRYRIQ